jgi:dipeptidyl aminopeptidase/acylaminoacyl peptidase
MLPTVQPANLPLIKVLSAPAVAPNGGWAVVAAVRPDFAADSYVGQLWRVSLDGGEPTRITRGFRDTAPQISPDGRLVAFLRAGSDSRAQVAIMPAEGGEPMVITDAKLGVDDFAFSPDSRRLAYVAAVPELGRYGTVEGVCSSREDPRHIRSLQFQSNGVGYVADRRSQLFVLTVPDPRSEPPTRPVGRAAKDGVEVQLVPVAEQLSQGNVDHVDPVWAGDSIIVAAARHEQRDLDLRSDLYRFDPGVAEPVRITDSAVGPSVLGSAVVVDAHVFFVGINLGPSGRDVAGVNASVFVVPVTGGEARALTDPETVCIEGPLAADGAAVLAVDQVRGSGQVIRVDSSGEVDRWAVGGSARFVGAGGGARVAVVATVVSSGELMNLAAPREMLTDFAAELADQVIVPVEQMATSLDGYPVHGWVVRPDGDGPHPAVLMIHGGPFGAYSDTFFDEAQVLAGAGYAVVMCNPRGSAGYGQAHGKAVKGRLGENDVADVLTFLDHCLAADPSLDAGRVGVMGGSYGGYLTAWIIAHEHRFAGAIIERGYLDPQSMIGAADIGWYFPQEYHQSRAAMDAQSPLMLVGQVRTPALVIHSEQDLRCPLATAERYYTELKLAGVEAELLIFPGENHDLSRAGTPHHRRARFEHILDWWARHLGA